MLLEFYDIPVKLHGKKIHLIEEPKCIYSMSFPEAIDMDAFEDIYDKNPVHCVILGLQ